MIRLSLMLIFLGVITLLTGCGSGYPDSTKVPAKYMPKVNPHPKYFMTVKGFIDPRLQQRIHLTMIAEYDNFNPKCNMWVSYFEGADASWQIFHTYKIRPNHQGNYQIKIPLDYYQPSRCNWHAAAISYKDDDAPSDGDSPQIIIFGIKDSKAASHRSGETNVICSKNSGCNIIKSSGFVASGQLFPFERQYTYTRNYYFKGKTS